RTLAGQLLAVPWLVRIGALSYSLYLWHWPILTLSRWYAGRDLRLVETLVVLCFVGLISYASWRWVERPFRAGSNPAAQPKPLTVFAVPAGVTVIAALIIIGFNGLPSRLSPLAVAFE